MTQLPAPPWKRSYKVHADQNTSDKADKPVKLPLSLERIVDAALVIVDAEGTEAVTMRRVADELGTGAASLYAYVSSRDELLRQVHDRVIGEIAFPDFEALGWREGLHLFGTELYRVYRAHSDIALYSFADIPTSAAALRAAEAMFAALLKGGVPRQVAAWALDRLSLYVTADAYEGWLSQKRFGGATPEEAEQRGQEYYDQVAGFFSQLPPDEFPTITANLDALMSGNGEERFVHGLEMFIAGMASTIEKRA